MMPHSCQPLRRPARSGGAFVLLEVIISLMILGFAVGACMHSFTQSLAAVRIMEIQTQAMFFAQQLMQDFEIFPPEEDREGGFGDDYRFYSFTVRVSYGVPRYRGLNHADGIDSFFATRDLYLEIKYNDGVHTPSVPIQLYTSVCGFEKFSPESKQSYGNF